MVLTTINASELMADIPVIPTEKSQISTRNLISLSKT